MIHAIELENFKGIAARQRIEFAPLTLLFGANSAGKSTVLHALVLVAEALSDGDADIDRTSLGADSLDLGGFRQYVHGHDLSKVVCIRVEFATPRSLDTFRMIPDAGFLFPDLDDDIDRAWVEIQLGLGWTPVGHHYNIAKASMGISEWHEPLLEMRATHQARPDNAIQVTINLDHPYVGSRRPPLVDLLERSGAHEATPKYSVCTLQPRGFDALPEFMGPVRLKYPAEDEDAGAQVEVLLSVLIGGAFRTALSLVEGATYLGPLRHLPARSFEPERSYSANRWANGLGAWDRMFQNPALVHTVNLSLLSLDIPYRIVLRELAVVSNDAQKPESYEVPFVDWKTMVGQLEERQRESAPGTGTDRIFQLGLLDRQMRFLALHDVGIGISQVIPVIAACHAETGGSLVLLEQPELHVHPRLQTGLGDEFIRATANRQLIIETHSEHLILRLLRRIRETHDGDLPESAPSFEPENLSVLYVEGKAEGTAVQRLHVDSTGEFVERWPHGFFEERTEELF